MENTYGMLILLTNIATGESYLGATKTDPRQYVEAMLSAKTRSSAFAEHVRQNPDGWTAKIVHEAGPDEDLNTAKTEYIRRLRPTLNQRRANRAAKYEFI